MKFNYAWDEENSNVSPEYLAPYGTDYPSITAQGNLTYLQFIDLIESLWSRAHPEIQFLPFSAANIFDREHGYVIYSLETRRTHNNNSKPKVHKIVDHPTEENKKLIIYTQSFDNIVKFSCIHKNPRVAEELVEAFEDFMVEVTPIFIKLGIEHCIYNRRLPDQHETRVGDDIASRTVSYLVVTQKIVYVDVKKLEEVIATITIADPEYRALAMETNISSATPSMSLAMPSASISHGRLSNLDEDDHLQYLNVSRHNALDHSFLEISGPQGPQGAQGPAGSVGSINALTDVTITSPEEFQTLEYNGTEWVNTYSSVVSYVRNAENTTLTTGTVVYLHGGTGDHASVKRADNASDTTSSKTMGLVAAPITASNNGPVITRGYVDGINLSVGWSVGDILWLGTGGNFTKNKPSAPEHMVFIGVVVRATNNGIVYVATQNGYEIDELHNVAVNLATLADGDIISYNSTSSLWENKQPSIQYKQGIPASKTSTGVIGQISIDNTNNIMYICTATNTWKRITLDASSFTNAGGFA